MCNCYPNFFLLFVVQAKKKEKKKEDSESVYRDCVRFAIELD